MARQTRSSIVGGLLLIGLGALFLVYQMFPNRFTWLQVDVTWPLIVVAAGALMLVFGLVINAPGMAIPASIIMGIGGLLYWQNATNNFGSWAYAWTLILGFVGVGIILNGLLGGERLLGALEAGLWCILISLTLFAIFGSVLGNLVLFGTYWPVLLIILGVMVLVRSFFRR